MEQQIFASLEQYLQKRTRELVVQYIDEYFSSRSGDDTILMNTEQAAAFLKVTKSALYRLTHKRAIPFSKIGRRNTFSKKILLEWVLSRRIKTSDEIEAESFQEIPKLKSRK
jgi:excisionase family DNA binding protein